MDIVVKGRNVEVPDHYRVHVADKLARLERYDKKVIRFDVELFHEPNRRQSKNCQRVEITAKGRGPVVRAEACAGDFYGALDCAVTKLENRLRKMHDRRRVHHGRRSPASVGQAGPEPGQGHEAPLHRSPGRGLPCPGPAGRRGGRGRLPGDHLVDIGQFLVPIAWLFGHTDSRLRP